MKRSSFSSPICLLVAVLLLTTQACNPFSDERESQTTTFEQNYIIDPLSLPDLLTSGKDAFIPVDTEPEYLEASQQIPVTWGQADYLRIGEKLFQYVWGESMEGWSINQMNFEKNCSRMDDGFQKATFRLFQNITIRERESRLYRYVEIDTRNNSIYIREAEYYPRLAHWSSIDLMNMEVSADQALRISENSGGQDKRLFFNDACDVFVRLNPDSPRYKGWDVQYVYDNKILFQIQINPSNGNMYFP